MIVTRVATILHLNLPYLFTTLTQMRRRPLFIDTFEYSKSVRKSRPVQARWHPFPDNVDQGSSHAFLSKKVGFVNAISFSARRDFFSQRRGYGNSEDFISHAGCV